jgi:hypothetical protein
MPDEDDVAYEWDDDYYEYWKDPLYGYEPDPEPDYPCCWDGSGRCCNPTWWDRLRWGVRRRLGRVWRRVKTDDPWGLSGDEGPF